MELPYQQQPHGTIHLAINFIWRECVHCVYCVVYSKCFCALSDASSSSSSLFQIFPFVLISCHFLPSFRQVFVRIIGIIKWSIFLISSGEHRHWSWSIIEQTCVKCWLMAKCTLKKRNSLSLRWFINWIEVNEFTIVHRAKMSVTITNISIETINSGIAGLEKCVTCHFYTFFPLHSARLFRF